MIKRLPSKVFLKPIRSQLAPRSYTPCKRCLQHPARRVYSSVPPSSPIPPNPDVPKATDLRSQFAGASQQELPRYFPQPKPKRSLRSAIYAAFFLLIGVSAGGYARLVLSPPIPPPAGSREDLLMVEFLHKEAEKLPIVKSLSTDPLWEWHDAYTGFASAEERATRLTTGPLAGARALGGFQRIFFNKSTGECVVVVWFGPAVSGWPGVTHGGLIATVLDETLGRCAVRHLPSQTGVTANLEVDYMKPTVTNSFYVIRSFPQEEGRTDNKIWVSGRLETLEGKVCVEAKGLFVVPKKYQTKPLTGF